MISRIRVLDDFYYIPGLEIIAFGAGITLKKTFSLRKVLLVL